jgi:restriction system protein
MTLPNWEKFMSPVLSNSKEEIRVINLAEICAKHFNLTPEEKNIGYEKSSGLKYIHRTWWAVTFLRQAGLLEKPKRGYIKITKKGKEVLDSGIKEINEKYLHKFPEFINFLNRSKKKDETKKSDEKDLTAEEKIQSSVDEINEVVKSDILERILKQNAYFFESLVVDLLKAMGYAGANNFAKVTKKTRDGGIDGILYQDALGLDKVFVQAKRYKEDNLVQGKEMTNFIGSLEVKGTNKGVFITTSEFSKDAFEKIKDSSKNVITINGNKLTDLMLQYSVGVRNEKIHNIPRIDEDYFEE